MRDIAIFAQALSMLGAGMVLTFSGFGVMRRQRFANVKKYV